ncbi:MAG: aldo/keto reductase [Treponema sp.]|jgi:predicted aldo/keto reductase-like oxidoreductase|nr:aldo/keto reductase [Treponema sp.]
MQYVDFGKTGVKVSRLGMGCMRLPSHEEKGKTVFDEEQSVALIHRAMDLGVNYFDTAPYYCDKLSEVFLGKALAVDGRRDKVWISTKNPIESDSGDDYEKRLERSLENLRTDHIDFYHFWGISLDTFLTKVKAKDGPFERAKKLKEQGLIRHISFSFHDREAGAEEGNRLIEILKNGEGVLESVLCQYNLMDRNKEPGIALAHEMGLGTVIMGPVGGGRLGAPSQVIQDMLPGKVKSSAEVALRFVLANQHINVALSGVSTIEQLEENAAIASRTDALSAEEIETIEAMLKENERLAELYCTGCKYCMPCPKGINIPEIFTIMNYHRVYKITDFAKKSYAEIGNSPWRKYQNAAACVDCGACEKKCPQSLPIREQLKETHRVLAG